MWIQSHNISVSIKLKKKRGKNMSTVKISDKATVEFLQFLKDNEVTSDTVRIHFAGMG